MREIGAAELRQSLGRLAKTLERTGEPVLLKVGRRPVGVIVSVRDFRERFSLKAAEEERLRLIDEILGDRKGGEVPVQRAIDELRGNR